MNVKVNLGYRQEELVMPRYSVRRVLSILSAVYLMVAAAPALAGTNAENAFDWLKSIAGEWQGKSEDGESTIATYEVSSGGTIVIEKLSPGTHPCMTSVYHKDKDSVMMTHYCNMDNQPRMRMKSFDAAKNSISFDFVDITNLQNEKDAYIQKVTLSMPDKQHLEQDWTCLRDGKESHAIFKFERKSANTAKK